MLRNRTLLAISLTVCAAYVGIGMVGPVRVLFAQAHGASLVIIGAMASAYLISNFVFQYPVGWLADRWGRKEVMIVGLLSQAILSLAYLFITDPVIFVILRFVEGIAAAAILPSARALIVDTLPAGKQGEAYGIFNAFFNAGFLLGPGIGTQPSFQIDPEDGFRHLQEPARLSVDETADPGDELLLLL